MNKSRSDQTGNLPLATTVQNGETLAAHIAEIISVVRKHSALSRILVVTPSSYSAFFLKRAITDEICQSSGNGLFNVEFMRIQDVADIIFDASPNRPDIPTMTPLVDFELIQNAVTDLQTPGPLNEHSQNDATIAAVQRTLNELALVAGDTQVLLQQLAANVDSNLYPQLLEIQHKYDGASGRYLTRQQKALIAAQTVAQDPAFAARHLAPNLIIVDAQTPPDAFTTLNWNLKRLSQTRVVNVVPSVATHDGSHRSAHYYSAMGAADEPRALIRNIMHDARNGINYGEMAVFYPTNDYASRIRDSLEAAGIPNCGPSNRLLAETPAGKFVALFLEMLSENMRRDTFTAWISSSPVINPLTGNRVPAVPWEVASRNANISRFSDATDWQTSLDRLAKLMATRARRIEDADEGNTSSADPETLFEAARNARYLKRFLTDLTDRINDRQKSRWSDWVQWLETIMGLYLGSSSNPNDDSSGHRQVDEALSQIRSLENVSKSSIDLPKFARTIQRLLRTSVGASSGWGTSVLVAPLSAGIASVFKSIHILGMAEGGIPGAGRADPLLPDNVRLQLDPDSNRLLTRSKQLELDRYTFQMALSSANATRLYWNRALMGATNESYPSPWFVDEIQKTQKQNSIAVKSLMDPKSDYVESVTPLTRIDTAEFIPSSRYEFALRDISIRARNPSTLNRLLTNVSFAPLAAGNTIARARRDPVFGIFDGNVGFSSIQKSRAWNTSATALERYAQCPYRYFLAHELNVDERLDPDESLELSPLDKGSLVHKILEEFLKNHGANRSTSGLQALRDVALTEIDRFRQQDFVGHPAIFELEMTKLIRDLETWHRTSLHALIGYDGEFKTEESFPDDDISLGQIRLESGLAVQLRGQIDLIAISPDRDRALVLDFKSGRRSYTRIDKDVTDSGKKLQLPIYSIVANEILGPIRGHRSRILVRLPEWCRRV